jgi:dihydrofolate reductase
MRHLVLFMHISLDGYVAGPNGEMDWINVNEEMFEYAGQRTRGSDTALYGRVTYQMMEAYWPTAADQPNPTRHDIEHSKWYNAVEKVVISNTLKDAKRANLKIVRQNIAGEIRQLKQKAGKDILMFGSPTAAHLLMAENLIDDYWLFVNPIILGHGIPLFKGVREKTSLALAESDVFPSGVVCLHYTYNQEQPAK